MSLLIEYQGEQHFKPIECYGGEEQFKIQQIHDKLKADYANTHKISLIEIPYICYLANNFHSTKYIFPYHKKDRTVKKNLLKFQIPEYIRNF